MALASEQALDRTLCTGLAVVGSLMVVGLIRCNFEAQMADCSDSNQLHIGRRLT